MKRLVSLLLLLGISGSGVAQDLKDYAVRVQTRDGSALVGTARLPAAVAVKTKFGDVQVDLSGVSQIQRTADSKFRFDAGSAGTIIGDWAPGKLQLATAGGKLEIGEADLQQIVFTNPIPAAAPPRHAAPPPAAVKAAKFKGFEVRKATDRSNYAKLPFRSFDPVALLPGGRHLALLDYESEEVVVVELATGACVRVKAESAPRSLVEKGGRLLVANGKSNSITVIDAKTFAPAGRVALPAEPAWITAPILGNLFYVYLRNAEASVLAVDIQTLRVVGPLVNTQYDRPLNFVHNSAITISPDNRVFLAQGNESHSPASRPDIFLLSGLKATPVWDPQARLHTDHGAAYLIDFAGARVYCGWIVYSPDLREKRGELPCLYSVAHPTKSLIFGTKKGENRGVPAESILVFDEEKLTQLAEIEVGDGLLALVPAEATLYAVGSTHIYPVPLTGLIPEEALARAKTRRIPVDLAKVVPDAEAKKADAVVTEGMKLLDAGKFDDARKKFDAALQTDPFGGAAVGIGMILARQKKYPEAIEYFGPARHYPFRDPGDRGSVYNQLGIVYMQAGEADNGIRTFVEGLREMPKDTLLLKNLGIAYGNSGKATQAYIAWGKALKIDPKQADIKKMHDEILRKIAAATTEKCEVCEGDGKFETIVQDQGGARKKIISECKTCKGAGKAWKRPCVDCEGSGKKDYYTRCDKCWGGVILESSRGNF